MTAKQYLNQAYRVYELIESNNRQIQRLRDMATNITVNLTERVKGGKPGGMAATVEKIVELESSIESDTNRWTELMIEIRTAVNQLTNADERLVLTLRYIEFKKWEDIEKIMHIDQRQVYRIHGRALKNIVVPQKSQ